MFEAVGKKYWEKYFDVYNKVVSPVENYSKFVNRDDIKDLVTEYTNSLR